MVPYDPAWPAAFRKEADALRRVFGDSLESVHHIGSTSVPGLPAKPVIDILAVLEGAADVPRFDAGIAGLGYRVRGECLDAGGTPGRFYYSKPVRGERTHHLHVCNAGHWQIPELTGFARYLREHADVAAEYGRLKVAAAEHEYDNVGYMARKHEWIRATVRAAMVHYDVPRGSAETRTAGTS